MSQNAQTNFRNLAAKAARVLKCVWTFYDKGLNFQLGKAKSSCGYFFFLRGLIHTDIKYRAKPNEALTDFVMGRQECLYTCN